LGLRAVEVALFPDAATCRTIEGGKGAVTSRQSVPSWLTAPRQVAKDPVEKRSLILRVFLPFVFGYYNICHKRSSNIWNFNTRVIRVQQGHAGTAKRAQRTKATRPMEDKDAWQGA